jgi:hypothetical protein
VLLALTGAGLISGSIAALVTAAGSLGALGLVGSTMPDAVTAGGDVTDALGYGFAITLLAAAACGLAERCERDGVQPAPM